MTTKAMRRQLEAARKPTDADVRLAAQFLDRISEKVDNRNRYYKRYARNAKPKGNQ